MKSMTQYLDINPNIFLSSISGPSLVVKAGDLENDKDYHAEPFHQCLLY